MAKNDPPAVTAAKNDEVRPAAAAPKDQGPKRTPAEWAEALGFIVKKNPLLPQSVTTPKPEHAAADELFGWSRHAYDYQSPADRFEITEADYREGLRTAGQFPAVAPHAAAIPPSQRERWEGWLPRHEARAKSAEALANALKEIG